MSAVDENDLETLSQEVKMDISEYVKQTKKALTRENLGKFPKYKSAMFGFS